MDIRTLVVDDEPLARKRIKRLLAGEPGISMVGECASGREAIQVIQEKSPELVFLDIQMPGVGGFEVLQAISEQQMPIVIFVTAYDQHALRAFEVHALDYLLKPFTQERFKKTLERARAQLAKNGSSEAAAGLKTLVGKLQAEQSYVSRFMVKSSDRVLLVKTSEVDWIESAGNYVVLHAGCTNHIVRETMRALEGKLCPKTFQRISRSLIVNLERIKELQPMGKGEYTVILTNGKQLTMSRGIRELHQALEPS